MNRKNTLELMAISFLFISMAIASLLVIDKAYPGGLDKITGKSTSTSVFIIPGWPSDCNMTFYDGLNLVSFYCITTYEDAETFIGNITEDTGNFSDINYIFAYRAADTADPWKTYNPELPAWVVQDLDHFSRKEGYFFNFDFTGDGDASSANFEFFYNGLIRIPTYVELTSGVNLIGYPTNDSNGTTNAFSKINDTFNMVYGFNNTAKTYSNYTNVTVGNLSIIEPYKGYWLYVNSSDTWVIDW